MIVPPKPLASYHWILVNTSGGKDSQTALRHVCLAAKKEGVLGRVIAIHSDLGRVEWPGTKEVAKEQADHYGVHFVVVRRPQGDLLDHVCQRGMWPDSARRYCTSDHKTAQCHKYITGLTRQADALGVPQLRILNVLGLRADESPKRAKKVPFRPGCSREGCKPCRNGVRAVDTWLPIHSWTEEEVWADIRASGVRYHHAYDLGLPRLSCVFCIFAPKAALIRAGRHNRPLLDQYVETERRTGHKFRVGLSIVEVRDALDSATEEADDAPLAGWCMSTTPTH